jgi:hypothetical protein
MEITSQMIHTVGLIVGIQILGSIIGEMLNPLRKKPKTWLKIIEIIIFVLVLTTTLFNGYMLFT